jgi:hypothetical protein
MIDDKFVVNWIESKVIEMNVYWWDCIFTKKKFLCV